MPSIKYDKLVRDRIPEIVEKSGKTPVAHILEDNEFLSYSLKKLKEEVAEYEKSKTIEELVDIAEVIYAILANRGIDVAEFERLRVKKNLEKGSFKLKICLDRVDG
jgi:predicted house-cleaning noncanonical NTP pyrophosphatase (MazG superfamily)